MDDSLESAPMDCEGSGASQISVYPNRLFGTDVMPLHHVPRTAKYLNSKKKYSLELLRAKPVIANGDGGEVERSEFLPDLVEGVAVSCVASEPEAPAFLRAEHGPAAPEGLAPVERGSLAPVIGRGEHEPDDREVGIRVGTWTPKLSTG